MSLASVRCVLGGLLIGAAIAWAATVAAKPADQAQMPGIIQRPPDRGTLTPEQKKAETNAAKIFVRAQNAMQMRDYGGAVSYYKDALDLFEQVYGPNHERLVEPLSGIVAVRLTQYHEELVSLGHPPTSILKPAIEAQTRIVKIYDAVQGVDPDQHVDLVVTLGDLYLYVGDGQHGVAAYRDAYQLKARLFSPEAADEMFSEIRLIGFVLPANPPGHPDWSITVGFDVAPDSRITIVDYQSDALANTNRAMRENFARARARPRFVAGEPVASALSVHYVYKSNGDTAYSAVKAR